MPTSGAPPSAQSVAGRSMPLTVAIRPVRRAAMSAPAAWPSAAQYLRRDSGRSA
jgi:hypothetical protein